MFRHSLTNLIEKPNRYLMKTQSHIPPKAAYTMDFIAKFARSNRQTLKSKVIKMPHTDKIANKGTLTKMHLSYIRIPRRKNQANLNGGSNKQKYSPKKQIVKIHRRSTLSTIMHTDNKHTFITRTF